MERCLSLTREWVCIQSLCCFLLSKGDVPLPLILVWRTPVQLLPPQPFLHCTVHGRHLPQCLGNGLLYVSHCSLDNDIGVCVCMCVTYGIMVQSLMPTRYVSITF